MGYFYDIDNLGSSKSPWVITYQCDPKEGHLQDAGEYWSDDTWRDKYDRVVLDDRGKPIKILSQKDRNDAGQSVKPCGQQPSPGAYVEMGHGKFANVVHIQICPAFFAPKRLDQRDAYEIISKGISRRPYGNVLDQIYPREFLLLHEYMHVVGGLDETATRRRPPNRLGVQKILDETYRYSGCNSFIRTGKDTRYVADCYRMAAQGIHLQIKVDHFGNPFNQPTFWHENIIDRKTMRAPTNYADQMRLWQLEDTAAGVDDTCKLAPNIEEDEMDAKSQAGRKKIAAGKGPGTFPNPAASDGRRYKRDQDYSWAEFQA
ncbi:MAG: hypothetical protein Q9227_001411 [Pyrenula ochraceoflavens]